MLLKRDKTALSRIYNRQTKLHVSNARAKQKLCKIMCQHMYTVIEFAGILDTICVLVCMRMCVRIGSWDSCAFDYGSSINATFFRCAHLSNDGIPDILSGLIVLHFLACALQLYISFVIVLEWWKSFKCFFFFQLKYTIVFYLNINIFMCQFSIWFNRTTKCWWYRLAQAHHPISKSPFSRIFFSARVFVYYICDSSFANKSIAQSEISQWIVVDVVVIIFFFSSYFGGHYAFIRMYERKRNRFWTTSR